MKKNIYYIILVLAMISATTMVSCGGDDDTVNNDSKKLQGTIWSSVEFNSHSEVSDLTDKYENNTTVLSKVQMMSGLRYTEEKSSETKDISIDLCEKSGHTNDALMTLAFSTGKCQIKVTTSQSIETAKRTIKEKKYKFEEGSYIVNVGGSNYEGITVYNYGVYRANGTLYIPLDGNGCITIEKATTYTEKQIVNSHVQEKTIMADYTVSGKNITFNYADGSLNGSFVGTFSTDESSINVSNNPFVSTIYTFKK